MKVMIINGPNLNLLGKREQSIYGNLAFEDYLKDLQEQFANMNIEYFQSNAEGELINKLQEIGFSYDHILLNAGGYTHTSVALTDAVAAIDTPVIEVHISNIHRRESFRHHSYVSLCADGVIAGLGLHGYELALESMSRLLD